ncbi:MAG TPA: thioredoxin domain-containing protein [Phycisphaerae bacterium]|nr:thioredoxin fold domain-containing protein [Phycisphaerales bacterium]HRX84610.1 thioredoxin domain-containing protein [Phycisphaerae bacterium]
MQSTSYRRWAVLAVALGAVTTIARAAEEPFQSASYEQALATAVKEHKLVFIDFYTTWCGPCKMLDRTTFKDEWVRGWLANKAVALQVDAEKDLKLADKFQVEFYPTLVFLDGKGKVLERQSGYVTAQEFRALAKDLDKGVTALDRARQAVKDKPDDPEAHLALGSALARDGKNDAARKEFIWCLDEGTANNPDFAKDRDGRLLEEMLSLAGSDEKTLDELIERRDAARRRLLDQQPKPGDAAIYATVAQVTQDPADLLATYDAVASKGTSSPSARALALPLFPVLLEAKRYDQIVKTQDVPARIAQILSDGRQAADELRKSSDHVDDETMYMVKARAVAAAAEYFRALLGAGEPAAAKTAAQHILDFDKSADTYHALAWEGYLSGKPLPECLDYAQYALKHASPDERANVIDTVARLMSALGHQQEGLALCQNELNDAKNDRQRWILSMCVTELQPGSQSQ